MTEQTYTIRLAGAVARNPQVRLAAPVDLELKPSEHVAIAGDNGAGKSLLVDLMTGRAPLLGGSVAYDFRPAADDALYNNVKYIAFRDTYGSADANYYYQQRWNAHDQDEVPSVRDLLPPPADPDLAACLAELFRLDELTDKRILLLSSGEMRRFQLYKALAGAPRVLIVDNPFIGLDAPTREMLSELLGELARTGMIQMVLVVSRSEDIPPFVTHVVPVADKTVLPKVALADYLAARRPLPTGADEDAERRIASLPAGQADYGPDEVVRLSGVSIRYGGRTILDRLDWVVRRGECWALSGENGAGKSTLLSLVCADNPQSYACDISLFGRKRGTGESIWDIKRHIGYVSPEMHRAYLKNLPALDIVASGLHDSIGLYRRPKAEELEACRWWMDTFGIGPLHERPFLTLSSGEQRLCLLARAFVKDPALLVLDEPLHGLDTCRRALVRRIIEAFCRRPGKTLLMVTHYEEELPACIDHRLRLSRRGGGVLRD
ncbi:MAG TPA: ATP-binding cassette domain-containing protein [Candidatus Bacteroides merdigallinarum]|uniref:ATP-binding cassette domain-containing protein n=1 Tax=Candidatus Bacteroides merdigallinarum TaxID=2838473 RepID=A0A9D2E8M1_9BACE|nr:ATP-binding cassette domain-containing protein [Candidatus Bacteroides merdigallinarum]